MAKRHELFPSKYVKHADLHSREITVTIAKMTMEEVGTEKEQKPVLHFKEAEKGLVLNVTNYDNIAIAYGEETDDWAGKQVVLYPDRTRFGGKLVDCIRCRPTTDTATAAGYGYEEVPNAAGEEKATTAAEVELDDSVPF